MARRIEAFRDRFDISIHDLCPCLRALTIALMTLRCEAPTCWRSTIISMIVLGIMWPLPLDDVPPIVTGKHRFSALPRHAPSSGSASSATMDRRGRAFVWFRNMARGDLDTMRLTYWPHCGPLGAFFSIATPYNTALPLARWVSFDTRCSPLYCGVRPPS